MIRLVHPTPQISSATLDFLFLMSEIIVVLLDGQLYVIGNHVCIQGYGIKPKEQVVCSFVQIMGVLRVPQHQ